LSDEGSDFTGGEQRSCQSHPETVVLSDAAHFAARQLKRRLEKNERWTEFCHHAAQTKSATGQTELASLAPPNQRNKARFMNLGPLLRWADTTLTILDQQPPEVLVSVTPERLQEKFGWLVEFRSELAEWSQWQKIADATIDVVRRQGYSAKTPELLRSRLTPLIQSESGKQLSQELTDFVVTQSARAKAGQRLPGSTEVVESSFGKFKALLGDQQKAGFTHLLLGYAALLGETNHAVIAQALERIPVKRVRNWCREHLGITQQTQRTAVHRALNGTPKQENPEEN
jgi:hypothetical protein